MSFVDRKGALASTLSNATRVSRLIRRVWDCPLARVLIGTWGFYLYFQFIEDDRSGRARNDLLATLGEWSVLMALFPFLVWTRHQFTKRDGPKEKNQKRGVEILLWISLVMAILCSLVVLSYEIKVAGTEESPSFSTHLGVEVMTGKFGGEVMAVIGMLLGMIIGGLAYLVQLWRDRWSLWLTGACVLLYGLLFLHWILPHEFRF